MKSKHCSSTLATKTTDAPAGFKHGFPRSRFVPYKFTNYCGRDRLVSEAKAESIS